MSWKDQLRTPSFRGIRFNMFSADHAGGRATNTHTFIDRSKPYTEDLGRTPRSYSLDAFVSGFDYFRQRDRLIEALETPGPGILIHPYYGEMRVNVASFRVIENAIDGNMVRFSLEFIEAGALVYPSVQAGRSSLLSDLRARIFENATVQFLRNFSVAGYPQYVIDEAQARILELATLVEENTSFVTAEADKISDLAASITDLRNDANLLVNQPALLVARMSNSLSLLSDSVFSRVESFESYQGMLEYGANTPQALEITASRIKQNENNLAFENFVKSISVFFATSAASSIDFDSVESASVAAQYLFGEIDALSETVDDSMFNDLQSLRAFVSLQVPSEDARLPRIFEFVNEQTLPAVVLSYELFGDTKSEADLIARNGVRDPNFMPGGQALKALTRA